MKRNEIKWKWNKMILKENENENGNEILKWNNEMKWNEMKWKCKWKWNSVSFTFKSAALF